MNDPDLQLLLTCRAGLNLWTWPSLWLLSGTFGCVVHSTSKTARVSSVSLLNYSVQQIQQFTNSANSTTTEKISNWMEKGLKTTESIFLEIPFPSSLSGQPLFLVITTSFNYFFLLLCISQKNCHSKSDVKTKNADKPRKHASKE